jgi:hypothetical protein
MQGLGSSGRNMRAIPRMQLSAELIETEHWPQAVPFAGSGSQLGP